MSYTEDQKSTASHWFKTLQTTICQAFERLEATAPVNPSLPAGLEAGRFQFTPWQRTEDGPGSQEGGGGGTMGLLRGRVFEKVGVNVSTVFGTFSPEFRTQIPGAQEDPRFWASGLSLVAHMHSPWIPTIHMNTRMITTTKGWFGGGIDLTPMTAPVAEDTDRFHQGLKRLCHPHDPTYYQNYKQWCDTYFYLPHRQEPRGVGGIFFDYVNTSQWERDFAFVKDVGQYILNFFPPLVEKYWDRPWGPEERTHQLQRRGRYVEFNLLYDRGTIFGLKTGGNVEGILMSLPPLCTWS